MLTQTSAAWDVSMQMEYFCNAKGQHGFLSTLAFLASHEACCRMAVFFIQLTGKPHQTGEPWHLSCHGGKTPAKLHVTLFPCAPAQRRVQGFSPARPASRGTCCATAVKPGQAACRSTPLRAKGAQPGVKGHCPLVSSSWRRGSRRGTSFRRGRIERTGARSRWR